MSDLIYISPQELNAKKLKNASSRIREAVKALQSVNSVMLAYEYNHFTMYDNSTRSVFSGNSQETVFAQSRALETIADRLDGLRGLTDSGSSTIGGVDQKFRNSIKVWWNGLSLPKGGGHLFHIALPSMTKKMSHLFGGGFRPTGEMTDVDEEITPLGTTKLGVLDSPKDKAKSLTGNVWENEVDNYREKHHTSGKASGKEFKTFATTKDGSVSIFGKELFSYKKYTDYMTMSYNSTVSDKFYSLKSGFEKEIEHYDFTDNKGFIGSLGLNGISLFADSDFDLAKGNAYLKAGADYNLLSFKGKLDGDFVSIGLSGELGAGGHLNAGAHNGIFTIDAGAAAGAGAGVDIEVKYREFWKATRDAFGF